MRDGLVRHLEEVRQELDVVARALDLADEVFVRQQERAGEIVGEVNLHEARRLGVLRSERLGEPLVELRLVEHAQPDRRRELKLRRLLEQRRRHRQRPP